MSPRNLRNKRTRKATIDDPILPVGEEWEVDFIVARACGKQGKKYLTRWKGFDSKADTWEPAENLAGAPDLVTKFNEEQDAKQAADLAAAKKRHQEAVAQKKQNDEVLRALQNAVLDACLLVCLCRSGKDSWRRPSAQITKRRNRRSAASTSHLGGNISAEKAKTKILLVLPHGVFI